MDSRKLPASVALVYSVHRKLADLPIERIKHTLMTESSIVWLITEHLGGVLEHEAGMAGCRDTQRLNLKLPALTSRKEQVKLPFPNMERVFPHFF